MWRRTSSTVVGGPSSSSGSGSMTFFAGVASKALFINPAEPDACFSSSFQATWNSGCLSLVFFADAVRETADFARRISEIFPKTGFSLQQIIKFKYFGLFEQI